MSDRKIALLAVFAGLALQFGGAVALALLAGPR